LRPLILAGRSSPSLGNSHDEFSPLAALRAIQKDESSMSPVEQNKIQAGDAVGNPADTTVHNTVEPNAFREAMSRVSASVHVVTTSGPGGKAGFTATAVCSVSDNPATLLVCLNGFSQIVPVLEKNRCLCVNTLGADDKDIADIFAGRTGRFMDTRFETGSWLTLKSGSPVLESAIVSFDCMVTEIKQVATHNVFFAVVKEIREPLSGQALLYHDRIYKRM
jgi:flavin reductase